MRRAPLLDSPDEPHRTTRELLRRAHEVAGVGSYEIDLAGEIIHLSPELAHLLRTGDAPRSMPLAEFRQRFYLPDDRRRVAPVADGAYARGESVALAWQGVRADGTALWVRSSSTVEHRADGTRVVVGLLVDVTPEREAARARDASEARLRQFIISTPAAVAMFDRDMRYLHVSDRWIADYHLEGVEIIGRSLYEAFPNVPEHWRAMHRRVLAGARERCDEDPFPRADGGVEWVQWVAEPWRDDAGEIGGMIMFAQLVTERRLVAARLQESEQRFRALSDNSMVGVYVHREGRVTYVNPAVERIFGYAPGELLGQDPTIVIHPRDRAFAEQVRAQRLAGTIDNVAHDIRGLRKDGTTIHIAVFAFAADIGGQRCIVGNIVDVTARHLAEQRLRESEERFRRLTEHSLTGIYIAQDERFAYVNPAFAAMAEADAAALVGSSVHALVHPDDRATVAEHVRRCLTGEVDHVRYEVRGVTVRGRGLWLEVLGARMDHGGRPALFGHVVDITARKQAEVELQRGERCWHTLVDEAPIAIGLHRGGTMIYANRKLAELWRFPSVEATIGMQTGDLWPSPFRELVMARARDPRDHETTRSYQQVARRQDGTTFLAHVDAVAIELPDGPARIAFLADVSDREAAQAAVRDSETRFRQLAETIDQVFWIQDADGRLTYVSPAFTRIWGRPPSLADTWPPAVHPDDRGRAERYRIVRPDGEVRWIADRRFPLRDEHGVVYRTVGTASDVTEREQLERQLRQSQKMEAIGVLAGGVAHDFNNLLAVILSYTALVRDELPPGDPHAADLQEVAHAAERAAQLTRQLLAFGRKQVTQPQVVDLNDVLTASEKMLRRLIGEHIELVSAPSPTPATAFVDPGQLEQVLMNLVVNARDAMPAGGRLAIDVAVLTLAVGDEVRQLAAGRYVVLSVTDTGVGMEDAVRGCVFEPFFTTKEVGKGTGLGLSTVFGIVQQSNGHVEVDSEVGRGSRFRIWLPYAASARAIAPAGAPAPAAHTGETILLVEDEDAVRRLVRTVLDRHGYTVLECRSPGDALVTSEQYAPAIDLLLTDVVMPLMSGDQLYARLRTSRPAMRVGFMSGYPERGDLVRTVIPHELFIAKPFTPESLLRRVRELLAAPGTPGP